MKFIWKKNSDKVTEENIETGNTEQPKVKKKFIKRSKIVLKESFKIIVILGFCAGLGIFLALGNRASDPDRVAEKYFTSYITNNYEEMYRLIEHGDSEFLTKDSFIAKCQGEKIYDTLVDYKIGKPEESGDTLTYNIKYKMLDDDEEYEYKLVLEKQDEKNYLVFSDWKVVPDDILVDDVEVKVPAEAKATFDGISIDDYFKEKTEDGSQDVYKLDEVYSGDHTLVVTTDVMGSISKAQYVTTEDKSFDISAQNCTMNADDQRDVISYSKYLLIQLYTYAMDGTTQFGDITDLFADDEQVRASIELCFNTFKGSMIKEDGNQLKSIDIKDVNAGLETYTYPDKAIIKIDYGYTFSAITGTTILNGIIQNYNGEGTSSARIHFSKINGAWKVTGLELPCIDYSKQ